MRVRTKLIIGFSVIAVLLWMIVFYAANNMGNLKDQFTVIEEEVIPATLAMNELEKTATDAYHETMKYILYDDAIAEEAALSHLNRLQEIEIRFFPYSMTQTEEFRSNQLMMEKIADVFSSVGILMDYKRRGASYEELLARDRATSLPSLLALQQEIAERKNFYIEELELVKSDFNYVYKKGIQSLFLAATAGILLAALAALITTRSILRPLLALHRGTEMVARGDLSYNLGTRASDEIGQLSRAFDRMTRSLSTSMTSIDNLNQEIAERKQAEEALQESQKFSTSLLENSTHATIVINPDTSIEYVNPTWEKLNGWSLEEIKGCKAPYPWWPANLQDAFYEGFKEAMKLEGGNGEVMAQKKNGELYWISMNWTSVRHEGEMQYLLINSIDVTERKQMEEALKQSEEKFSKAFLASPNSISISTLKDGIFIEVNDSFIRDKGYSREETIGHTSQELGLFVDPDRRTEIITSLKKNGRIHNELIEFKTKTGEFRTGLLSAELITINNEPCMIVINTDITEHKQAEEQLRLLGSVTHQVLDSTIVTDNDFNITYMNKAAENLLGYSFEDAKGRRLAGFDVNPLPRSVSHDVMSTVARGKVWSGTITKRRKDGTPIICDCQLSPLYDENEQIIGYIDVERDVTRQKETEAKLQIHKLLIENILSTMPGGVLVIGNDDRIILANEAFHNIFDVGKRAIKAKLLDEILPITQLSKLYAAVKQGEHENTSLEFRHNSRGLEKIVTCNIIKMDGGRTLLTFTDISREREEEEKLYLTDRLASIGEMAAGLAHELNNPLTGILALSQLLINSEIPPEYQEDLNCMYNEAKRAAEIVKNVLLFARNNNYENGHASANEVINNVLRLREYEEKVNNITVETNFKENLPDVAIDKFQLQQVFLNMTLNAEAAIIDTNRPGKLMVTTERSNGYANIIFSDNGCGIKKQVLPRIFDPFFTTKEIGKGTGLGLSICYGIIVKNGGKITVKSQVNEGTTFTIKMPIVS